MSLRQAIVCFDCRARGRGPGRNIMIETLLSHSILLEAGTFIVVASLVLGEVENALGVATMFGCLVLLLWQEGEW